MPFIQFQFRRGTGAEWSAANTVLAPGEMGIDTDTYRFKIGDGTTAWNNLTYSPVADGPQGAIQYNDSNAIAGSSNLVYTDGETLSIAGNLLPQANVTYSLGNANLRWANLFLAGNTIDLGGSQIKSDFEGAIVLVPPVTIANPNPTALVINATGSIVPVETVDGVPNANAVTDALTDPDSTFGNVFVLGNLTANQSTVLIGNISIQGDTISSADGTITIDPAAAGSTGTLIVEGNLQVKGNVTYIDSQTLTVNDLMINMANNANTSSQANGGGIAVGPVGSEYATLTFDNGNTAWRSNINMSVTGNVSATGGVTATGNISGNNVSGTLITGTLATAAQPNITSVGNLSGLTITGNVTGNLLPSANITYDLGSATQAWRSLYISGNTLYIADESMAVNSVSGIWSFTSNGGEITLGADSIFANSVSAGYILGNGSLLTGIVTASGNVNYANIANVAYNVDGANVSGTVANATYAATAGTAYSVSGANVSGEVANSAYANTSGTAATVTANAQPNITSVGNLTSLTVTGNVSANYVFGNGSQLTGLPEQYSNVNVAAYLPTYTGNVSAGNVTATGNISATYVLGNGSQLTGLPEQYGNANVAAYLPTYTGNVAANNVTITGVFSGNGSALTALPAANITGTVANANYAATANYATFSNEAYNVAGANVSGTVANANYAAIANIAYNINAANISGTVANANYAAFANVAYNVDAANISGTVANANYAAIANIAYNVDAANISGTVANANYANTAGTAATVTSNSQPNITSVGNLTSLTVSGDLSAANITASGVLTVSGTGQSSLAGNLNMNNRNIVGLAEPVNSTDAATKQYVDAIAEGLHIHAPCAAATPANLAVITGGTVTYNNGTDGVGATLTVSGSTYGNIDGVNIAVANTRILVKSEANAAHNGIYVYSNATVLTRSVDFDTPTEMAGGDFTFVQQGTLYNDTGWVCTDPVVTVGTSAVNFVQFSGAGTYTAGTGLTLDGGQFSISNTAVTASSYGGSDAVATFTVNAQGQLTAASNTAITANAANLSGTTLASTIVNSSLTSVGNLTALTVTGNISGNYITASEEVLANRFEGNGYQLTSINAANISGTVANANYALYSNTVLASSQPNITSVGNLTTLTVTGNISGNYILGNGSQLTGIVSANSFGNIVVANSNTVAAGSAGANLTLAAGNAMSITTDPANNKVTIAQINFSQNFGFVTGNVDQEDDLGLVTLTANQAGDLGTVTVDGYVTPQVFILPTWTVATLPNPVPAAQVIYVSDEAGGAVMAFSDGTNWRRCTDRAIVT